MATLSAFLSVALVVNKIVPRLPERNIGRLFLSSVIWTASIYNRDNTYPL
jgi:hypothetical protein